MKVMFPQNIQKGFLSGFGINIFGFNITLIQMFLMAIGIVIALGVFSSFSKAEAKTLGLIFAILIILIFVVITFFKVSEMNLVEFIAKKIRDSFLDTHKKFQINFKKNSPIDIMIARSKSKESKQKIEIKSNFNRDKLKDIEKGGLL
ncbi:MAG: PrgI family protein [Candidatus Peribacteria bacterium]|jgi:low affinity Fe/Cu permease|nr:PrgI family protein [Candidatus Peribacteria bacterium]